MGIRANRNDSATNAHNCAIRHLERRIRKMADWPFKALRIGQLQLRLNSGDDLAGNLGAVLEANPAVCQPLKLADDRLQHPYIPSVMKDDIGDLHSLAEVTIKVLWQLSYVCVSKCEIQSILIREFTCSGMVMNPM
jgi:hypothetical protein